MRELSDDARSLLDDARGAHDPSDGDRRRLRGAMVARLGAAAVVSSSAKLATASATGSLFGAAKVIATVALVGAASAGVVWQAAPASPPTPQSPRHIERVAAPPRASTNVVPSVVAPAELASVAVAPASQAPSPPPAARARAVTPVMPVTPANGLAEEVRVLSTARAHLREGQAELALTLLDGQAVRFERSALREEYLAARVRALRELGRETDARAAAADFAAAMPDSALLPKKSE
jgi:hypothetical protein